MNFQEELQYCQDIAGTIRSMIDGTLSNKNGYSVVEEGDGSLNWYYNDDYIGYTNATQSVPRTIIHHSGKGQLLRIGYSSVSVEFIVDGVLNDEYPDVYKVNSYPITEEWFFQRSLIIDEHMLSCELLLKTLHSTVHRELSVQDHHKFCALHVRSYHQIIGYNKNDNNDFRRRVTVLSKYS